MNDQLFSRLDGFKSSLNFDRGKSVYVFVAWYLAKRIFFLTSFPWPSSVKSFILGSFGATVVFKIII